VVKAGMVVLDMGCGMGFFSVPLARMVVKWKKGVALRVRGDEMDATDPSPSFAESDVVIVDETKIAKVDFVFVHLRDRRSLIRQAYKDGQAGWRLVPLNKQYPEGVIRACAYRS
jgi:SOS-response transcriptional repressor LexA